MFRITQTSASTSSRSTQRLSTVSQILVSISCIGLLWVLLLSYAQATPVFNLYDSTQRVADQSVKQRKLAQERAFKEVIVRVTGSASSLEHPKVKSARADAERYLLEYSYTIMNHNGQKRAGLYCRFDELMVNRLLKQAGLSIWGEERAVVLAWLALEKNGVRRLLKPGSHVAMDMLVAHSKQRGMPLKTPLLDARDKSKLSVNDVWSVSRKPIMSASKRYQTEGILIGKLFQDEQQHWISKWSFWLQGKAFRWQGKASKLSKLMAEGTDKIASEVAQTYAVSTRNPNDQALYLVVDQVTELEDYAALQRLLLDLTNVASLQIRKINGSQVQFQLQTQGSLKQLQAALALEQRLRINPVDTSSLAVGHLEQWYYSWQN